VKPRPIAFVIESERASRRLVRAILEKENYRVFEVLDGRAAERLMAERQPDIVLLELELPGMNGVHWLRSFRERSQIPIIVLSEHDYVADKVEALDAGANDFLLKPFGAAELLARLRVLRRCVPAIPETPILAEGNLKINVNAHEVTLDGCPLNLTVTEEALFYRLVQYVGKVVTPQHLLRSVWGNESKNKLHELQVLIAQIRRKLETQGNNVSIQTAGRIGYQLFVAPGREVTNGFTGSVSATHSSCSAKDR
jgi:two-component system KDP operon response regulator KdpE